MSKRSLNTLLSKLKSEDESSGFSFEDARQLVSMVINLSELLADTSGSTKLSKAVSYASAAVTLGAAGTSLYEFYKKSQASKTYTVKIMESDPVYEIVENWFMAALPEEKQLSVYANSMVRNRKTSDFGYSSLRNISESTNDPVEIVSTFDGTIIQTLEIAGHTVKAHTYIAETGGGTGPQRRGKTGKGTSFIGIICNTLEARRAVLAELQNQAQYLAKGQPSVYTSSTWGDFKKLSTLQSRSAESVILKNGQMDRIIGYLENFFENEEYYLKVDIPFRTGIMLYGTPGSGKSSTAVAIANTLKMNVYIITLSAINNDEVLAELFSAIPDNSVIVLEDIDIVSAVKERDENSSSGVTMSGMLNVLDGLSSAHGCVTIMTTNRLDVLDDAVIRPGRVDLLEHLDFIDSDQLRRICEYTMEMIPDDLPEITSGDGISPADIIGIVRKHVPSFENAGPEIVKFVNGKIASSLMVESV